MTRPLSPFLVLSSFDIADFFVGDMKVCANLSTTGLNSILYKYEKDIVLDIRHLCWQQEAKPDRRL